VEGIRRRLVDKRKEEAGVVILLLLHLQPSSYNFSVVLAAVRLACHGSNFH
jgi:hypothetical protein